MEKPPRAGYCSRFWVYVSENIDQNLGIFRSKGNLLRSGGEEVTDNKHNE